MNVISFPKLGLIMNISPEAFHIASKPIYWYAIVILSGFFLGALFVSLTCEKRGVKKENVWDVALYGLIAGIIGARIYYVVFALDEFDNFFDMLKIYNGGLAIYGGIIGALVSTYLYCRIHKLNMFEVADVCAPGLFIGQAIGRYGNFVNAEVYGKATNFITGMSINGSTPVHPLFFYESSWNIIGLILILLFRNKEKAKGEVFLFYIFWYSFGRLFLEGMRDSQYILYLIPNILGISQLVALIGILSSLSVFILRRIQFKKQNITTQ